ncbi:hypothetical protein ACFY0F_22025 [Streptomyces sp. NPDC001544]|uniref:hypothetical protein n=1 Tax=Streptomyces sp. NPDC001544 TaxID=3364584 RepID=UPI0036791AC3
MERDEDAWGELSRGEKVLAGTALAGVTMVAVAGAGLFLLLVVLVTVAAFPGVIELDGLGAVLWAVLLVTPCAALASAVLYPARLVLRDQRALRNKLTLGWLGTFLTAVLVLEWTPGLHCHSLWPAVCVATLDVPLYLWVRNTKAPPSA